jgi:hypothetical protein
MSTDRITAIEDTSGRPSRRRFLAMLGAGGTLAAVAGAVPFTFKLLGSGPKLDLLGTTAATFRSHIGDTFNVAAPGRATLTLVDVQERGDRAFSLYFDAHDGLGQGTQPLRHATLGRFDLFVVPGRTGEAATRYEAAFNHGGI